jgi:hypothetical protein
MKKNVEGLMKERKHNETKMRKERNLGKNKEKRRK